ncbi:flagellar biosynthesis protein FliQ [Photobacterium sp. GJ3]|uniref:flagellar biosynthesis protein FliQ n=1 Tax=Photobacterium sp. GJ3 TaxID=2829502 RepID=UPI001B8C8A9A|nr:flagellar biosynthesis protein FliQ [Photobacterium sp. GJ3]QUJ66689.1 flagellar biosynthesis protein FliQ [Photobacterium sp. GJ3]
MTPESFVEIFQEALYMVLLMVTVIVVPGLLVGLVVAIFQAATSINEQTLSFLPRLVITLVALMVFGHMMTRLLMDYFYRIIEQIPQILY